MSTTIGFKQFGEDAWFVYSNGEVVSRDADGAQPFWSGRNTGHPAVIIADLFRIGYDSSIIEWVASRLAEVDSVNSWNDVESREEEDAEAGFDLQLWDQMDMARAVSELERAGRPHQQALVSALLEIHSKAEQGNNNYAPRLRCQEIRYIARDALNQSGLA